MKKLFALLLCIILSVAYMSVSAEEIIALTSQGGNYLYYLNENGTTVISRYLGENNIVKIPSSIAGKKVTEIGGGAFADRTSITSVSIPNSVTSIGIGAFSRCENLLKISIPDSVTNIGDRAFYYCSRLSSITLPKRIKSIGDRTFFQCASLISITVPKEISNIGERAFYYCESLTEVSVPEGVTDIGSLAFAYCKKLISIILLNNISSIGERAFTGCPGLRIYCDKESYSEDYAAAKGIPYIVDVSKYRTLKIDSHGPDVVALKQRMFELGYYTSKVLTEAYTKSTAQYVMEFEQVNGLPTDGIADPVMQALFYSNYALPKL